MAITLNNNNGINVGLGTLNENITKVGADLRNLVISLTKCLAFMRCLSPDIRAIIVFHFIYLLLRLVYFEKSSTLLLFLIPK